jgi:hypothetical protein
VSPNLLLILAEAVPEATGTPGWLEFVGGGLITIIVAWLGYKGYKAKEKGDKEASRAEISRQEIETILSTMRDDITELRGRIDALDKENRDLEKENALLLAKNRTKDDLIWGFTYWHKEGLDRWIAEGCPTPPGKPPYPWQVRQHLSQAFNPEGPHSIDPP